MSHYARLRYNREMTQTLRDVFLATLICCGAAVSQEPAAKFQRDWVSAPAIVQIQTSEDVYVVGDPHADYGRLTALLQGAKIISAVPAKPEDVQWAAGQAVVVFTGDLIDKGTNSLGVIALVRALQNAAQAAGGRVVVLMGNHEAEFLAGPGAKKVAEFAGELNAGPVPAAEVAACHGDLGQFLCTLPFAARVNDWFFSHGGNSAGRSLATLASDLQSGVDQDGFGTQQLVGDDSLLEARLGKTPWFGADAQTTLAADAQALGVAHLVQGHQPGNVEFADGVKRGAGEMFQRYGLLFLEDTGMSAGVGDSQGAVLHIAGHGQQRAEAICFDGTATKIWDTKKRAAIGKIAPCGVGGQ